MGVLLTKLPFIGLAVGVAGLAWLASATVIPDIEGRLEKAAIDATSGASRHGVNIDVAGRDIVVSGLAHSEIERLDILERLEKVEGARRVSEELTVLDQAKPYNFRAEKTADGTRFEGVVPDARAQARLLAALGDSGETRLTLASGEPDANWSSAILAALPALDLVEEGALVIEDQGLSFTGTATDRAAETELAVLSTRLPEGYALSSEMEVPAAAIQLAFAVDANTGITVTGDAPEGFGTAEMAAALGIDTVGGDPKIGAEGDPSDLQTTLAALGPWLGVFETATIEIGEDGVRIDGAAQSDISPDALQSDLIAALAPGAAIDVAATDRSFDEGHTRVNPFTGRKQENSGGYWYPVVDFVPSEQTCEARVSELAADIKFVADSTEFAATATPILGDLTLSIVYCLYDDDLMLKVTRAETDPDGVQATALNDALVARGVPIDRISVDDSETRTASTDLVWTNIAAEPAKTEE